MRDNFDTVLPKTERFFSPPLRQTKPKAKPLVWGYLIAGGIVGASLAFTVNHQEVTRPAALSRDVPAPSPPPPLPEVRRATMVPVAEPLTLRAQLIHLRAIGTWENDRMPDGRTLATRYLGELPSAASLPRTGGQPGDMWFTRNDGHSWVLAPVTAGSQTTGWVDP